MKMLVEMNMTSNLKLIVQIFVFQLKQQKKFINPANLEINVNLLNNSNQKKFYLIIVI